jgi:hypothetical protein
MSVSERLERILAGLTPSNLRDLILELAAKQPADSRSSVTMATLTDALTAGVDLGEGAEGWEAQLRLKRAIKALVGQIEGLRFIEGDS